MCFWETTWKSQKSHTSVYVRRRKTVPLRSTCNHFSLYSFTAMVTTALQMFKHSRPLTELPHSSPRTVVSVFTTRDGIQVLCLCARFFHRKMPGKGAATWSLCLEPKQLFKAEVTITWEINPPRKRSSPLTFMILQNKASTFKRGVCGLSASTVLYLNLFIAELKCLTSDPLRDGLRIQPWKTLLDREQPM